MLALRTPRTAGTAAALVGLPLALTAGLAGPAAARPADSVVGAVFVQDDRLDGNGVVAYARDKDGALTPANRYETGGRGGRLSGAVVDFTASQGALLADRAHRELYSVNPGSDNLTVFRVHGTRLHRRQIVSTDGSFPVSVAAHGNAVYVLNARDGASLQGYRHHGGRLVPMPSWHRQLNLPTGAPEFTHTPGQVAFTPDGKHLIVTTKAATNSILVFSVDAAGALSEEPVVRTEPGGVPFAVTFDTGGHLAVALTGTNTVATYAVAPDGHLLPLGRAATGQVATCWIASNGDLLAASNAGSPSVTTLRTDSAGTPSKLGDTTTDPGTVDAAFTSDGGYLYVQTGARGVVDEFAAGADGALTPVGSTVVPNAAGADGIAVW